VLHAEDRRCKQTRARQADAGEQLPRSRAGTAIRAAGAWAADRIYWASSSVKTSTPSIKKAQPLAEL
jgi:hypothetical protein